MPDPALRRAPRLGPEDRLAPHITRRGRFRRVDPLEPRKLPGFGRLAGMVAWAVLIEESFRRAYRRVRADRVAGQDGGDHS